MKAAGRRFGSEANADEPLLVARADHRRPIHAWSPGARTGSGAAGSTGNPTGPVQATGRVIGANDRILVAVIGVGGQVSARTSEPASTRTRK